ncbi:MAG: hypothetical protein Q7U47_04325 [Paludibacter sp.]|nr:hypothetical protein [Paludibacter sp.]
MKKPLLFFALFGQMLFAQQINVTSVTLVKSTEAGGYFYPIFSPACDYLLATSVNYSGLKQITIADNSVRTISTDAGAGYGVQISADGNSILYKKTTFENNLRSNSVISYSRTTGKHEQLVAPTREAITQKFADNKPQFVKGKTLTRNNISIAETAPVICIEDQKMVLYTAGSRKELVPNGSDASYFWASISPDRKNIAYTVAGKGTFVCRIDGTNSKSLGKLNAPVWLNNQWLVGMDDKDDGERLLSSTLITLTIDGKVRQTLTTPANKMAMYPAASADGSRIAYNTEKGEVYLLNVQIK